MAGDFRPVFLKRADERARATSTQRLAALGLAAWVVFSSVWAVGKAGEVAVRRCFGRYSKN